MSDATKPEETKEVKETPRSTAEADFTKYKVGTSECLQRAPLDLIRVTRPPDRAVNHLCRLPQISSMPR